MRETLRKQRMRQLAEEETAAAAAEPPPTFSLTTSYRAAFTDKGLPSEKPGVRTRGTPDNQWRSEVGILAPHRYITEASEQERRRWFGKNDSFSRPVEMYKHGSEKIA